MGREGQGVLLNTLAHTLSLALARAHNNKTFTVWWKKQMGKSGIAL